MSGKTRIVALVLAITMLCSTLIGVLGMWVGAAEAVVFQEDAETNVSRAGETDISLTVGSGTISNYKIHYVRKTGQPNTSVKALTKSSKYSISFEYEHDISDLGLTEASVGDLKSINFTIPTNEKTNAFKKNADAELAMAILSIDGNIATIEGTLTNIECRSANQPYLMMKVTSATTKDNNTYTTDDNLITLDIETYLSEQGSSGGTTTDNDTSDYSSDIIVENVYLTDSTGERLDEVTKDSPPFTLVITYAEYGLKEVDDDEFTSPTPGALSPAAAPREPLNT